jgi:hypothetical protein
MNLTKTGVDLPGITEGVAQARFSEVADTDKREGQSDRMEKHDQTEFDKRGASSISTTTRT